MPGWMRALGVAVAAAGLICSAADAKPRRGKNPHTYDAADYAKGAYDGAVISGAQEEPKPKVRVTVTKVAPSTVRVSSEDPRLPTFTTKLIREKYVIQNAGGPDVFMLDLNKVPHSLDVTVAGAAWSGVVTR